MPRIEQGFFDWDRAIDEDADLVEAEIPYFVFGVSDKATALETKAMFPADAPDFNGGFRRQNPSQQWLCAYWKGTPRPSRFTRQISKIDQIRLIGVSAPNERNAIKNWAAALLIRNA